MRTEMTRREREAAEQTDSDLKLVAREIAPFMRSRGFAKAGPVTWRRDRPELQSRLSLRAGTPAQGPFAKISGTVHVELVASPPGPRFRESIIRTHPEIMSRDDAYLIRDADDRTALLEDLTTQLVPWLLHYDSFDAMWRALLHGEPPAAGGGRSEGGKRRSWAFRALEIACFDLDDPRYVDEAIEYCNTEGFVFDLDRFDGPMATIGARVATRR